MAAKRRRGDDDTSSEDEPPRKKICESDRKITCGLDFGTAFSAAGFVQSGKPDAQTIMNVWPAAKSFGHGWKSSEKVPSEVRYKGQDFEWGFEVVGSEPRHNDIKLLLDPSQARATALSAKYEDPMTAPPEYGLSEPQFAEKVVADYMTKVREHTEEKMRLQFGEAAIHNVPIEWILTVPAVWSDAAQAKTQPEAAAMYALQEMDVLNLKVGDTFVVFDAGGGTVDLITYTVVALKPILKAMEFFEETVKRDFCGTFQEKFLVPVPGMAYNEKLGINKKNKMRLDGTEVRAIFEPVLNECLSLVTAQIKAANVPIKAILMGSLVEENKPVRVPYETTQEKSTGRINGINVRIYFSSDLENTGAPKYRANGKSALQPQCPPIELTSDTAGVKELVVLKADLSRIPTHLLTTKTGADGQTYYKISYEIQITFYSASTTYELIHNNINYGHVTAEHV
ncbi:hypothetical protein P7C71_g4786, partial [Lecanoromycetidae sp. Uapishka_2]